LLSLLPLLLSMLPLLLAAGSARAVAAELCPGPGSRLLEAATRAFKNKGSSAESDNDEGYDDLLQNGTEMKKRRAAQK
jgi:hypothetical protein